MARARAEVGCVQRALLTDPCAFLIAEHGRHRVLLGHLARLARPMPGPVRLAIARALVAWLSGDLPLHLADEAESIVPRIASMAASIAVRFGADNARLHALRRDLSAALAPVADGQPPGDDVAPKALAFAQFYRQRLADEEAEFLLMARHVLGEADRQAIAAEMRQRRN